MVKPHDHPDRRQAVTATFDTPTHRELDQRSGDGIEVRLLWSPTRDEIFVTVCDDNGESFELAVRPHEALDAFNHPFAYAASRPASVSSPAPEMRCSATC